MTKKQISSNTSKTIKRKNSLYTNLIEQLEVSIRNSTEIMVYMRRVINKIFW